MLKHGPVKVFADKTNVENDFDKNAGINITRVSGLKIFIAVSIPGTGYSIPFIFLVAIIINNN